jgi:hypothetical protein
MIEKLFMLYIMLVSGSHQPFQIPESSSELQKQILSLYLNRESDVFDLSSIPLIPCEPKFFSEMNLLDDFLFILFWNSYGYIVVVPNSRATGWKFINDIKNQGLGSSKFKTIRTNYEAYLYNEVLKKILSNEKRISKNEMEKLLLEAMNLYHGKFRSIWRELVEPGPEKFDEMRTLFLNFQQTIDLGIQRSLEELFNKIKRNADGQNNNNDLLYPCIKHFCELVKILSNDERECWGLRWISEHKDPFFILSYFYFHRFHYKVSFFRDIRFKIKSRKHYFETVFNVIRKRVNFKFIIEGNKLIFSSSFRSPFPYNVMGAKELKAIITKIVSKIIIFNSDH